MKIRRVLLAAVVIAAIGITYFVTRDLLLTRAFEYEKQKLFTNYRLKVNTADIHFSGLNQVYAAGISMVPMDADTLIFIGHAVCKVSFIKLVTGFAGLSDLRLDDVRISVYNESGRENLSFLKKHTGRARANEQSVNSYKEHAEKYQSELLRLLRTAFEARNLRFSYADSSGTDSVYVPLLQYDLQKFSAVAVNVNQQDTFHISAQVTNKKSEYQFDINHTGSDTAWVPFLNRAHGFKCSFRSINGGVKFSKSGNAWLADVQVQTSGLRLNYWRLSGDNVLLPEAKLNSLIRVKDNSYEIDSSTRLTLSGAVFNLSGLFERSADTLMALSIHMPEIPADTFFDALPGGMCGALKGISCSGTLAYDMDFSLHSSQPDSLLFSSSLKRKDFHIIHFGNDNLARINGPFIYDAYQGTHFMRKIEIGNDNPAYTPLERISHYLPLCIMTSEDPGFMEHRGFIPEAMRESLAQDYKEKRFARGGSTISMQLVKNVFLKREKTISRKVEEALIVYLIENLQLVSKQRMMEVYLNVIEWGPNIYGVGEAAQFYFHKSALQLTLPECVFLAAIIPRPRSFAYQFDKSGQVKPYIKDFYKLITGRLVNRGLINESDTAGVNPSVKLTGPAARLVLPGDSVLMPEEDSIDME